jgi:hypothetical protein
MFTRALYVVLFCLALLDGPNAQAKGSDGLVVLKGAVHHAVDSGDKVTFEFTGKLSFRFFTAPQGASIRKQIDLDFEVQNLRIEVPAFGEGRGSSNDPFVVNFANVAKHSMEASESGEAVTIVLFNPTLSFNISGVVERAACTHAQIIPDQLERRLRQ